MPRELNEVVYVDGVRTAFGRAGPKGLFWRTRADDMAVKVVRELLRRNPQLPSERIDDVIMAATAQVGDQGLTLGRDVALLAGLPHTVPGFAVDRMCAGALTAVTAGAGALPPRRPRDRRQFGRADRRRHGLDARLRGGRRGARPRAEDAARRVRVRRRRAGADGARAGTGDAPGARAGRPDARPDRPL